jgi:hypothetical protein
MGEEKMAAMEVKEGALDRVVRVRVVHGRRKERVNYGRSSLNGTDGY